MRHCEISVIAGLHTSSYTRARLHRVVLRVHATALHVLLWCGFCGSLVFFSPHLNDFCGEFMENPQWTLDHPVAKRLGSLVGLSWGLGRGQSSSVSHPGWSGACPTPTPHLPWALLFRKHVSFSATAWCGWSLGLWGLPTMVSNTVIKNSQGRHNKLTVIVWYIKCHHCQVRQDCDRENTSLAC